MSWGDRKYLDAHLKRQELLYKNAPRCPKCSSDQVQLINQFVQPAKWKCRRCRHPFTFEPDGEKNGSVELNKKEADGVPAEKDKG